MPPSSPRKTPTTPSRGHKRKASENWSEAGATAGSSYSRSASPFASSSSQSSPLKRSNVASSSRRNSRQSRTFRVSQDADEDEALDADADGEEDEEYLAEPRKRKAYVDELTDEDEAHEGVSGVPGSTIPARGSSRPKRANATPISYAVQPLPSLSDEEAEEEDDETLPSVRRRPRKPLLPASSDIEEEPVTPGPSRRTPTTHPSAQRPMQEASPKAAPPESEPEMSEEAKAAARAEKEAQDLRSRWTEEYFEIVEQLPLEIHRTFALMRELEGQMQTRCHSLAQNIISYRDERYRLHKSLSTLSSPPSGAVREGSEDEAENLLGNAERIESAQESKVMDREERRDLLRNISQAANESVKAAEEKMGLASTAYNWIDRHIRRLDADMAKLETSITLGLRTGTEESRGAREALGLPVDEAIPEEAGRSEVEVAAVSAEAESASLTKAAGAARRSGRRKSTTPASTTEVENKSATPSRTRSTSATPTVPRTKRKRKPSTTPAPDTSEMPIDKAEPTYCYCDQVSFDEMVGCDNPDCPYEWFHFICVGLTAQPKGNWYCRFCAPKRWKGEGMQVPPNAKRKPPGYKK